MGSTVTTSSRTSSTNGPEPGDGSWVYAATAGCPDRLPWQRRGPVWFDGHGCRKTWEQLVDPVDTLPSSEGAGARWQ